MGTIFAIGGGEVSELNTYEIDKKVVEAAGKEKPKLLFIPTASGDAEGYVDSIKYVYGEKLGCKVDALLLLDGNTSSKEAREKILTSDIIYVGGGNTRMMIETWKQYEVDKHLAEAYEKDIILSGMSAGSICWFDKGHSEISGEEEDEWNYIIINGINLLDGIHCPHHNEGRREEDFAEKMLSYKDVGIAIDNNCAIEFKDDSYKVYKSQKNAKAYKVYKGQEGIIKEELANTENYKEIQELMSL